MSATSLLGMIQEDSGDGVSAVTDASDKGTDVPENTVDPTIDAAGSPTDDENSKSDDDSDTNSTDDDSDTADTSLDDFLTSYKELTGRDLPGDHDSVDAAKASLADSAAAPAEPDEDAANWQHLMDAAQEDPRVLDALQQALSGESPKPAEKPAPKSDASDLAMPKSLEEVDLWRTKLYDADGKAREDADPTVAAQLSAFSNKMNEILFQLVTDPGKLLSPHTEQIEKRLLDTSRQESQQQSQERQTQVDYDQITAKNSDRMFIDGDQTKFSPFGEKVKAKLTALTSGKDAWKMSPRAYQEAIDFTAASVPSPQKIQKPSSRAGRKPAVTPAPDAAFDEEKFFRDNPRDGLVKLLLLRQKKKT